MELEFSTYFKFSLLNSFSKNRMKCCRPIGSASNSCKLKPHFLILLVEISLLSSKNENIFIEIIVHFVYIYFFEKSIKVICFYLLIYIIIIFEKAYTENYLLIVERIVKHDRDNL